MSSALRKAAIILEADEEIFPWHELSSSQVARVRDELTVSGAAPSSVNVVLSAIRGAARAAYGSDPTTLTRKAIERLNDIRSIQNEPVKRTSAPGRALTPGELGGLFTNCLRDHSITGKRDAAMLLCLYSTGMTCRELVELSPNDWQLSPPSLTVGVSTNAERKVLLGSRTSEVLALWLALRSRREGRMFLPIGTDQIISGQQLTQRTVSQVIKKRACEAALSPIFAEDLRHSAIKALFDAGAGYQVVRRIVGPIGLATLARYDPRVRDHSSASKYTYSATLAHTATPYHRWRSMVSIISCLYYI